MLIERIGGRTIARHESTSPRLHIRGSTRAPLNPRGDLTGTSISAYPQVAAGPAARVSWFHPAGVRA
jgi:hypothetical protein